MTNHPPFYCNAPDVKGCPLSPLLFAVAIELSCHRQKKSAVHCSFVDHRISLYEYDVVLFLSHPEESLPPLLELNTFGELSGCTLNWDKSEFMSVNDNLNPHCVNRLLFRIVSQNKIIGLGFPQGPQTNL